MPNYGQGMTGHLCTKFFFGSVRPSRNAIYVDKLPSHEFAMMSCVRVHSGRARTLVSSTTGLQPYKSTR